MNNQIKNILTTIILLLVVFMAVANYKRDNKPELPDGKDSTNIAIVQFTVLGMDSARVGWVQDRLDTVTGITFNFACWADTIIFIEYNSLKTNETKLEKAIKQLGYHPKVRKP